METLTAMSPTTQMCRIVLRDIGNRDSLVIGNNNSYDGSYSRKRNSRDEEDKENNPVPKRLRTASDSGYSGSELSGDENIFLFSEKR